MHPAAFDQTPSFDQLAACDRIAAFDKSALPPCSQPLSCIFSSRGVLSVLRILLLTRHFVRSPLFSPHEAFCPAIGTWKHGIHPEDYM